MTRREKDIVRYALGYLAEGDGRRAHSHTRTRLGKETTKEIRAIANEMRGPVFARARRVFR